MLGCALPTSFKTAQSPKKTKRNEATTKGTVLRMVRLDTKWLTGKPAVNNQSQELKKSTRIWSDEGRRDLREVCNVKRLAFTVQKLQRAHEGLPREWERPRAVWMMKNNWSLPLLLPLPIIRACKKVKPEIQYTENKYKINQKEQFPPHKGRWCQKSFWISFYWRPKRGKKLN